MSILRLASVAKQFGAITAVRSASVAFEPGAVHAVIGENGAGKSTLLKIAAGVLAPDAGAVEIDGAPLAPHTAAEAIRRGVAMVAQHFSLIGVFSVLENIELGAEPRTRFGLVDHAAARAKAEAVARELGVALPLDARVSSLGVGDRQRVEIVRALFRDARVVILDEPTAVLTPGEADALYATLGRLKATGRTIVVVTHKLDEVRRFADRVTVVRRGEVVFTRALDRARSAADEERALAAAIMGASLHESAPPGAAKRRPPRERDPDPPRVALEMIDVCLGRALNGVSLRVRGGEVVGVAGIEGNGQGELVAVLAGLEAPASGSIRKGGGSGGAVAVVHGDRQREGLVLDAPVAENLVLGELGAFARGGRIDRAALEAEVSARLAGANLVPPDPATPARALSGGNQQKIVVARAVARAMAGASLLVAAHPTRGVDQRSARAIHAQLEEVRARGVGVLVLSSDLAELRQIADRIVVLTRGRIVAEFPPDAPDEAIGRAMLAVPAGAPGAIEARP